MRMITVRIPAFIPLSPYPRYPPHIECRWLYVPCKFLEARIVFGREVFLKGTYSKTVNLVLRKPTNKDSQIC